MDREKVIKGLECCSTGGLNCKEGNCPYWSNDDCLHDIEKDALELLKEQQHKIWELNEINEYLDDVKKDQEHQIDVLKEQEAVEPRISTAEQRCGNCNKIIEMDGWVACPWCGKHIDWEGWWKKNGTRNQDTRIVR